MSRADTSKARDPAVSAAAPCAAGVLAYCRPGFESECAQELAAHAAARDVPGFVRAARGDGFVEFRNSGKASGQQDIASRRELIFARQLLCIFGHAEAMRREDRLAALLPIIEKTGLCWYDAWVEAPDSDAGRALAPLCRALNAALVAALKKKSLLDAGSSLRLHVCMTATNAAIVACADVADGAPWPGGIPRLRFPRGAPSRSTLKLEEAFLVLLDENERERWLAPGMSAVDLGAAPGGWTWQLARRSIRTIAVDNGAIDTALLASGLVEHLRADGFRYQPPRTVDWLVCDMVEQPRRIASLVARWIAEGWCRRAMFNLKLPMKKRYDEVRLCLSLLREEAGADLDLRAKQLYHDREEITVFARKRTGSRRS